MRIALLQDFWQEFHGLMIISAMLKQAGYHVDVFIRGESDIEKHIVEFGPDIIGFSVTTGGYVQNLHLVDRIKSIVPEVLVVFGGPHPTLVPEIIEEKVIDVVVIGEGEETFLELVKKYETKQDYAKIKGLWAKIDGVVHKNELRLPVQNLDSLPMPDWEIYYKYPFLKKGKQKSFTASRGCPYNCSFCASRAFKALSAGKGSYVRQRKPENVIKEIAKVKRDLDIETVAFDDAIFTANNKWLNDFLNLYRKEIKLPFSVSVRADFVTEKSADLLKKSGCYGVSFGVESGDEELRFRVLNKRITDEQILKAAKIVKKHGITLRTTNMFGLPGETPEMSIKTIYLNRKMGADYPFAYIYQPYPGTELYDYCLKNGYLPPDFSFDHLAGVLFNSLLIKQPQMGQILAIHRLFYLAVKYPKFDLLWRFMFKFPRNVFYDKLFQLSLVLSYWTYKRRPFWTVLELAYKIYKGQQKEGSYKQ